MRVVTGRHLSKEILHSVLTTLVSLLPAPLLQLMSSVSSGTQRHVMFKSAFGCTHPKHHSSRGAGVICLLPRLHPPEPSPKRHKNPPLSIFHQLPQMHFQELHSSPKTPPFGDTQLHHPPSGTSPEPSPSQHPPFPWLAGSAGAGPPEPVEQDMVCKEHIHVANDIGVRLLVKGFVSDPSPGQRERERSGATGRQRVRKREQRGLVLPKSDPHTAAHQENLEPNPAPL